MTTNDPGGIVWLRKGETNPQEPTPHTPGSRMYCAGDPQGQWLEEMPPEAIRITLLQIAATCAGMFADPVRDTTGYSVLIAPGESEQMTKDMARMSGCALAVRAWLRLLGLVHEELAPPYRIGAAFENVYNIAVQTGALFNTPKPSKTDGCIVTMGRGLNTHMAVLSHVDAQGYAWTIDGGQTDSKGRQAITWRQRKAHLNSAGRIQALDRRELNWCVDPARLAPFIRLQWRLPWRFGSELHVPPWELAEAGRAFGNDPSIYEATAHNVTGAEPPGPFGPNELARAIANRKLSL